MATDDVQRLVVGTASAPASFRIPGNGQMQPKAIFASYDGGGAGASFVPALKVFSDGGKLVGIYPVLTTIAAGGSADVSWFPWRRGVAAQAQPTNPLGGLLAWYDFSDATTIALDGSGNIEQILDKSGNNHTATQATAGKRPGQTVVNGLSAGLFNSAATTELDTDIWADSFAQPITVAMVVTQTIAGGGAYWPGFVGSPNGLDQYHVYIHHNDQTVTMQVQAGGTIQSAAIAPFTQTLIYCQFNGGSSYLRINGVQTNGAVAAGVLQGILLGTQFHGQVVPGEVDYMDGAFCEVLYYQQISTAAQRAGIESYLKAKWGTP